MTGPRDNALADGVGEQKVYFDELAELFATFAADTDGIYRGWLSRMLPPAGRRAVDLGCGSGRWTGLLLERYAEVVGVDIAAREIEMARAAHPRAQFVVRSLLDVDGTHDVVLCVNTVHHLRDHERVLPHLRGLVAPGGTLVVVDVTDPGGWATMEYQVADAFADAEESYRERSRDHRVAARVLELHLHPLWLEHALNDVPLTRPEFVATYGRHFPGARFAQLHRVVTAMAWTAPAACT